MNRYEFKKYIETLGFKFYDYGLYEYEELIVNSWNHGYNLYNGYEWIYYAYDDLTPLLKLSRSIKLKKILKYLD